MQGGAGCVQRGANGMEKLGSWVMDVTAAIRARKSVRAFTGKPVPEEIIREVLEIAARAPSGGNVQPWRIFVLREAAVARLKEKMVTLAPEKPFGDENLEYTIYPPKLKEPYRTNRFGIGEQMYEKLGIAREDKAKRIAWMANNYQFFGASNALMCFVDKQMDKPQWSDLGMYLENVMLLFQERGISTCAQEIWSLYPHTMRDFCGAPDDEMLFCGMAIGYEDPSAPVNEVKSKRMPLEDFTTFVD